MNQPLLVPDRGRRRFLKGVAGGALAAALSPAIRASDGVPSPSGHRSSTAIAAYYLRGQMYTCVPAQVRRDMEWMANVGTNYVCVGILECDLIEGQENIALIGAEAARVGMKLLAVPSRWGGLTAGAPKVPSLFSVMNPETWLVGADGSTAVAPNISGVISSIHHPATLEFFRSTLAEMYRQHPAIAGFVLDEPKCFIADFSKAALAALGKNAPLTAHYAAARKFFTEVCAFAKQRWPEKLTIMFQQAHLSDEELAAGADVRHLDYYGTDGRPWTLDDDARMSNSASGHQGGKGKVLLNGIGEKFIRTAHRIPGRRSFFLIENHNLPANMLDPLRRNYPSVLALRPDMATYYYYPCNVDQPDEAMETIGAAIRRFVAAG